MPISDCDVRDPRIRRTRAMLQSALRDLMRSKSLDEISVQDITDAATLNRATFYDHYTDKFALLDAMVAGGFHHLLQQRSIRYDSSCPAAASAVILAVCDFLAQSHGEECRRQSAFEPLVEAAITAAICRVLLTGMARAGPKSEIPTEMIATAASGAIYGAVKAWFKEPNRPAPETIVPVILRLVLPILQSADARALS